MKTTLSLAIAGVVLSAATALAADAGTTVELDSLKSAAPAGWKKEEPTAMQKNFRKYQFRIAKADGDKEDAEVVVFFFGAGGGGTKDANLQRWKGQFKTSDGKPAAAQEAKRTVNGLPVSTVDTSGEYSGMGGPMTTAPTVSGYRLLGAIIEAPGGMLFIKFTGPIKTVAANQQKFEQLLASFQPDK